MLKKQFFKFTLPSIAAMWVFAIYTMVDGIFIAQGVGNAAMSAVTLVMPLINLVFAAAVMLGAGTSALVASMMGQGDQKKANETFTLMTLALAGITVVIVIGLQIFMDPIIRLLGSTDFTHDYMADYFSIILWFMAANMFSYFFEVLVKTDGFPVLATLGICLGAVVNIFLDWWFVLGLGWGVKGAAVATGLSQIASFLVFFIHFLTKRARLRFTRLTFRWRLIGKAVAIGISDSLNELAMGLTLLMFNQFILRLLGSRSTIMFTTINYVALLVTNTFIGISQGAQPLVSFAKGERDDGKIRKLLRYSYRFAVFGGIVIFALIQLLAVPLTSLFVQRTDAALFHGSVSALRIYSVSFLISGFNIVTSGYFASIHLPKQAIAVSVCRGFVLILLCLAVLSVLFGATGIWLSALIAEALCAVLCAIFLIRHFKKQEMSRQS